jgi:type I restriction enzyme S subunit
MLGEKLPRACVVPDYVGPAIVKADCARLRVNPGLALPGLVAAGLNSPSVRHQADELVHGVGRPRLGLGWLKTLQFPLAPLPEQHRIVEAIESYFTRLDDAVATLERVQRNLKRYRASVLKAAVEGRLVPTEADLARAGGRDYEPASALLERILAERRRRWHEAGGRGSYQEPLSPNASNLRELPAGWCWATVDQLAHEVRYGTSAKTQEEQEEGVPVVRMGNIVDGFLDLTELKYLPASHDEFPDLLLQPGDVLFNRTNSAELVGKTAVFHGQREPCRILLDSSPRTARRSPRIRVPLHKFNGWPGLDRIRCLAAGGPGECQRDQAARVYDSAAAD